MKSLSLASIALALVASANALSLQSRAQVLLADGKSMQFGTARNNFSWQASGILYQGCKDSVSFPINIANCYALSLSSDPTAHLNPGAATPRQRIEFLSPGAADGVTQKFKWRYYLSSTVGTSSKFFHLMQLFSRGDGSPIITLDAVNGQIKIKDYKRDCVTTGCPSIPLASFTDRTTVHFVTVTYGPNGRMDYVVKDAADQSKMLLRYTVTGQMGSQSTSIKFGAYKATFEGMSAVNAAVGDFVNET
ncbi:hypothetical protein D9615_008163 [Tricholomella constricta]|uniref:Uncharacterized protein n=1 Tax=Tricholomella constricta TaxID=117010 RepID=A0A8H5M033_9AGAR|nr:hypothetical protein D9615_008163 [Tricholomella constricta]